MGRHRTRAGRIRPLIEPSRKSSGAVDGVNAVHSGQQRADSRQLSSLDPNASRTQRGSTDPAREVLRHLVERCCVALLMTIAACGDGQDQGSVEGLVVGVDGGLTSVHEFSVLADNGTEDFAPAEDGDFAFPLQHLRDHMISGEPIVVFWEDRDGVKTAVFVDDAP